MSLPRKRNIEQLKRLRKQIGEDIGDKTNKKNIKSMNNLNWTNNPLDRKIDTYEGFVESQKIGKKNKSTIKENLKFDEEAFVIWENYLMENEDFVKSHYDDRELIINDILEKYDYKEGVDSMVDEFFMYLDSYLEGDLTYSTNESVYNRGVGPGNFGLFKNNVKDKPSFRNSTDIFKVGKYIQVGNIEGFIDSVDEDYIYITKLQGVGKIEKVSYKEMMKKINFSKINENSGLPSEFWDDEYDEDNFIDDYDENDNNMIVQEPEIETQEEQEQEIQIDDDPEIEIEIENYGTEDNPNGKYNF